jgi:hypothetical protein
VVLSVQEVSKPVRVMLEVAVSEELELELVEV